MGRWSKGALNAFVALVTILGSANIVAALDKKSEDTSRLPSTAEKIISPAGLSDRDRKLIYQRTFEAALWGIPAVSMYQFRKSIFETLQMGNNDIVAASKPADSDFKALTSNASTPYISAFTDLSNGPVVLEVPPATDELRLYGQVVDVWQLPIGAVGPAGADKGKGGRYLLIPPKWSGSIPKGYFPIPSSSNTVSFAFRSIATGSMGLANAHKYSQSLKLYPLADNAAPKPTRFVDFVGKRVSTIPTYDISFMKEMHEVISREPINPRDKVMLGMLASIGVEKGKPFSPDAETTKVMESAIQDAYRYTHERFWEINAKKLFWPDRHYSELAQGDANNSFKFETDDQLDIDPRAVMFAVGTFYPETTVNSANFNLGIVADSQGRPLQAGKGYTLTLFSEKVPVRQFWALTAYDEATFAFIDNPLKRPGLMSTDTLLKNADGSVTLYIGPKSAKGMESNWIPTAAKRPYLIFRMYGADRKQIEDGYKLPDLVRVD